MLLPLLERLLGLQSRVTGKGPGWCIQQSMVIWSGARPRVSIGWVGPIVGESFFCWWCGESLKLWAVIFGGGCVDNGFMLS